MQLLNRLLLHFRARPAPRVFITGMPKSGTTAILQLMGLATGCSTVNDPFYRLDRRGTVFRDDLYSGQVAIGDLVRLYADVFAGDLIKDPNLVFFHDSLGELFPQAGWVFTVRDPRDNIRSLLNRLGLAGHAAELDPLPAGLSDTWRRVLEGRTPAIDGADPIERLARRWVKMAETMLAAGDSVVVSRYEDFMAAKELRIRELCRSLGLDPKYSVADDVDRPFQPQGDRHAVWCEFFGASELEAIERICGPWMQQLGYARAGDRA